MSASFRLKNGVLSIVNSEEPSGSRGSSSAYGHSANYNGKHSVLFLTEAQFNELKSSGFKTRHTHSWEDWFLIPSSRPVIVTPAVRTKSIEIPGLQGTLDLTETLTGYPLYNSRTGSLNFIVDNGHVNWAYEQQRLAQELHGKRLKMILLDDMEFYYEGRFTLNEWKSEAQNSSIVINYELNPFKHPVVDMDDDWLWDPFNFETGVIRRIHNVVVSGLRVIVCPNGVERGIYPRITCSSAMTVSYAGKTYNLPAGVSQQIELGIGDTSMTFTGNGTVSMSYRGGYL